MSIKGFDREDLTNMLFNSTKGTDLSNLHSPLFQNNKLSKKESDYLLHIFTSDADDIANEKASRKLKSIDFLDSENNLTFIGKINAIRLLSLEEQCNILGIQKKCLNKETYIHPEYAVIDHFERSGWLGRHCEGDIIFDLISCSLINILDPLFKKAFGTTDKFKSYIPYINPFKTYTDEVIHETLAFTLTLTPETVKNDCECPFCHAINNINAIKCHQCKRIINRKELKNTLHEILTFFPLNIASFHEEGTKPT